MTAKEYLGQAYRLDQKINSDIKEAETLREMISGVGSPDFEERHNPNRPEEAPFVKGLERVWEMERKINAEIDRLVDLKEQIRGVIEAVPDADEKLLLRYRYLDNYTWVDIATRMNYSIRWIYKLHGKALDSVGEVLKEADNELFSGKRENRTV